MSDTEKIVVSDSLDRIDIGNQEGEEYARWFATFMPASDARKRLVWNAVKTWASMDEPMAIEFLEEQGIDPQEMMRRKRDAN